MELHKLFFSLDSIGKGETSGFENKQQHVCVNMHVYYRIEQKKTACLSQHVCVGYLGQNMKRQRTFQPPKGGARQRLERNAAQAKIQFANSSLARLLMLLWSTGTLSPQMIQKIAAATKDDIEKVSASSTCPFDDITFLADMGTKGANPQNMHSELTNRFNFKICEPGLFMLPLVVSAAKKVWANFKQGIMLPHVLFANIYHIFPALFTKIILPSQEILAEFWSAMADHPNMANHAASHKSKFATHGIPISLHGDGVPVTGVGKSWSKSLEVFTWKSMIARGPVDITHLLIFQIYSGLCVAHEGGIHTLCFF